MLQQVQQHGGNSMKNRTTILNSILAAVLGIVLLVSTLVKVNCPHFILPEINIPYMAAVSLTALVLTYFVKTEEGCIICEAILATVTFAVLPFAAGLTTAGVLKLALCGGIVFTVLDAAFSGMTKRMELADTHKCAVIPAAFGLYLACQCFANILL